MKIDANRIIGKAWKYCSYPGDRLRCRSFLNFHSIKVISCDCSFSPQQPFSHSVIPAFFTHRLGVYGFGDFFPDQERKTQISGPFPRRLKADMQVSKCTEGSSESKFPNVNSTSLQYLLNSTFTGCPLQEAKV